MPRPTLSNDTRRPGLREQQLRVTVPALRLLGFLTLALLVVVHKRFVDPELPWPRVFAFFAVALAHSVASWGLLWFVRGQGRLQLVAERASEIDVAVWAYAMACTGGGDSWLFPLMIMRAADHVTFGLRRVLMLGHYSAAAFLGLILWEHSGSTASVTATEWGKLGGVYVFNLYLALSASAIDQLNERLRRTRLALETAKEDAEAASVAKSAFLATMSHEIRTPLTSIIGYAEMLAEDVGEAASQAAADLAKIEGAGRHLLGLVNDVLDLAKVEAGKMELVATQFDLVPLVGDVVAIVRPLAAARRNSLHMELPANLSMHADEGRVRQILFNLLSNACKFTERGSVSVRVWSTSDTSDDERVWLEMSDTGIGMTPEQMTRAFEAFVQVDTSPTRRYGGTGLGLGLTRDLCALMGGDIHTASQPQRGSTFTVCLPRALEGSARSNTRGAALASA